MGMGLHHEQSSAILICLLTAVTHRNSQDALRRFLRYDHWWRVSWTYCDGVERRCRPKNSEELQRVVSEAEGSRFQGIVLPSSHPRFHVPRWRLHTGQRHRWKI